MYIHIYIYIYIYGVARALHAAFSWVQGSSGFESLANS